MFLCEVRRTYKENNPFFLLYYYTSPATVKSHNSLVLPQQVEEVDEVKYLAQSLPGQLRHLWKQRVADDGSQVIDEKHNKIYITRRWYSRGGEAVCNVNIE